MVDLNYAADMTGTVLHTCEWIEWFCGWVDGNV